MTVEAVIFDCDGTLVDSETLAASVIVEILAEHGAVASYDEILAAFRGGKFANFVSGLCARFPQLDADDFSLCFRERSITVFEADLQPIPGAVELVRNLKLDRCVASNGPRKKIETSLRATGLLPFFNNRIVSAYEIGCWKPDPQLIWSATKLMSVDPQRCLLVEDSVAGIEAGLAAGVQVIGFRLDDAARARFGAQVRVIDDLSDVP
ncbi:MAG TPA: HAD-IA family hydrolase, partial [Telmatospirillum sp.]|nr:HAD-IA family hydrolase [Telmatospirillum sp.]